MVEEAEGYEAAESSEEEEEEVNCESIEFWDKQIEAAEKRLKPYYRKGDRVVDRFIDRRGVSNLPSDLGERSQPAFRLNLFHTNVSTISAMLYGRIPRVDVSRRFADAPDDTARIAAEIFQRLLNTSIEEPGADFPSALRGCLQDRLLPGQGIARVRYEFQTRAVSLAENMPAIDAEASMKVASERDPADAPPFEIVDESAPVDYVHWRDFLWGFGRMYSDLPWVAFRTYMTKDQARVRFPSAYSDLDYTLRKLTDESGSSDDETKSPVEEAEILEIWYKRTRQVVFWSKGQDGLLEVKNDPLGLRGFFPCAQPMIANPTTTAYIPTPDFHMAQDLYNEIDLLQTRIGIITQAIKVVGVYDQNAGPSVGRMLQEGSENDLIPVDNWAAFAEKGGIKGVVDWFPVSEIVEVLTTLKATLDGTIELLYQVTGLSDILRGAEPAPRESAASSMQRARFASVRVQQLQEEFSGFASDLARLRAEIIAKHWEPEIIYAKANCEAMMEDPSAIQEALKLIKTPTAHWPWRVEIKSESIAQIDYAQLKNERGEFLITMATYVQAITPLLEIAPQGAPLLLEMMKWGLAGFKGSQQIEGVVDKAIQQASEKLANPEPQQDPAAAAEQAKQATQAQASELKIKEYEVKAQADMQEQAQKHQHKLQEIQAELEAAIVEMSAAAESDTMREKMQARFGIIQEQVEAANELEKVMISEEEKRKTEAAKPRPASSGGS